MCSRDRVLRFLTSGFFMTPVGDVANFFENSLIYSLLKVNHWCQRHRVINGTNV